jgi:vacuolar-type H+-ATPase subunit I/STV1
MKDFDRYDGLFIMEYFPELIGGEEMEEYVRPDEARMIAQINDKLKKLDYEKEQLEESLERIKRKIRSRKECI